MLNFVLKSTAKESKNKFNAKGMKSQISSRPSKLSAKQILIKKNLKSGDIQSRAKIFMKI